MQIKCQRAALSSALAVVSGVVPSRTTHEILKNIKLQCQPGELMLLATDGDGTGIRYRVDGVEAQGSAEILLPTARVIAILRELTDADVTLELTGDAVWLRSGFSEFRLSAENAAAYPPVPPFDESSVFLIGGSVLRQLIRRTIFATDVESARYALGGVLVEVNAEQLVLAATDSRRLAVASAPCRREGDATIGSNSPVVSSKSLSLVERSLGDDSEDVQFMVHERDFAIRTSKVTVTSQLVQGRFPDYRKVIPSQFAATIDLVVGTFHSAVRQSQILTNEESRGVDFTFGRGMLKLASVAADVGQSKIELPISYDGPELNVTFDPRYLGDFLKVLDQDSTVQFHLIDGENPGVLKTADNYTYVIMPLARDR